MRLRCVRVLEDRVDFVLEVGVAGSPDARASAAAALLERLPGLSDHRCSTGCDHPFAEELAITEPAHLFEHLVLEIMSCAGSPRSVHGETMWRKGDDAFRVSVYDDDDAVCVGAARLALCMIDDAFADRAVRDPRDAIERLRSLRAEPSRKRGVIDPARAAVLRYPATPEPGAHTMWT
ncbi:MAG TPA: hypothetical protein DCP20_09445 [Coriobacteriia bacterium]|nr:hypothetical protein [Coriobacteriia bacterium]